MANLRRVLWHLLGGTRGGPLRIRILQLLRDRPYNTNQVASLLGIDYKTAQHHLRVLTENRLVSPTGDGYGAVFLFTKDMEESLVEFDAIAAKVAPAPPQPPAPPEVKHG
jgi:predicted transcriptional regulator